MTATYNGENVASSVAFNVLGTVAGFKFGSVLETSNTLRAATVSSLINGNYPLATSVSTSIKPAGVFVSSGAQVSLQGSIDYLSRKK